MGAPLSFQRLILTLHDYWSAQGCLILQPYDMEMGAGTFHPGDDPARARPGAVEGGLCPALAAARPTAATARIRTGCSIITNIR